MVRVKWSWSHVAFLQTLRIKINVQLNRKKAITRKPLLYSLFNFPAIIRETLFRSCFSFPAAGSNVSRPIPFPFQWPCLVSWLGTWSPCSASWPLLSCYHTWRPCKQNKDLHFYTVFSLPVPCTHLLSHTNTFIPCCKRIWLKEAREIRSEFRKWDPNLVQTQTLEGVAGHPKANSWGLGCLSNTGTGKS